MSHKEPVAYMDSLTIDLTEAIVRLLSDEVVESEAVGVSEKTPVPIDKLRCEEKVVGSTHQRKHIANLKSNNGCFE